MAHKLLNPSLVSIFKNPYERLDHQFSRADVSSHGVSVLLKNKLFKMMISVLLELSG